MSSIYQRKDSYVYYQFSRIKPNGRRRTIQKYLGKYHNLSEQELDDIKKLHDNRFMLKNPLMKNVYFIDDLVDLFKKHLEVSVRRNERTSESVKQITYVLDKFLSWYLNEYGIRNIESIISDYIKKWMKYRMDNDGVSNQTIMGNLVSLRCFFNWCINENYLDNIPMNDIKPLKIQNSRIYPTKPEFYKMKSYLSEKVEKLPYVDSVFGKNKQLRGGGSTFHFYCFYFQMMTGCRISEIVNLKWKQSKSETSIGGSKGYSYLDLERYTMTIYSKKRNRIIPIEHISNLIEKIPRKNNYRKSNVEKIFVFENPVTKRPYSKTQLHYYLKKILKELKMDLSHGTLVFRRGFIMDLIRKKVPIYHIGKIVGHRSEQITQLYGHMFVEDLEESMYKIMEGNTVDFP